jgi:hypothetical protein
MTTARSGARALQAAAARHQGAAGGTASYIRGSCRADLSVPNSSVVSPVRAPLVLRRVLMPMVVRRMASRQSSRRARLIHAAQDARGSAGGEGLVSATALVASPRTTNR